MGGICGFVGEGDGPLLDRMLQLLQHRGPADQGTYTAHGASLGYRHQYPAKNPGASRVGLSADGNVACVLDGYLFNNVQLRDDLKAHGIELQSDEPTELVANLYMKYGTDALARLDGAFAAALCSPDGLLLVRDPLGEKPLYFSGQVSGTLLFASEVKALLAHRDFTCEPNPDALNRLMVFSFVPGEETMFRDVYQLLPGSYLRCADESAGPQVTYWDLDAQCSNHEEDYYVDQVADLTTEAVKKRLITDGPVGAFLSGGLDSSAVVAVLARLGVDVLTFSVGFGRSQQNELMYAKLVAEHCGTRHRVLHVEPSMFLDLLPNIMWNLDDPLCDCIVVPNYLLAIEAASHVKLLFNGEGGDPLFGGPKNKFLILNEWYKHLGTTDVAQTYLSSYHKCYDYLNDLYTPGFMDLTGGGRPLEDFVRPFLENNRVGSFLDKLMYINTKFKGAQNILVKVDKMLSAHALQGMSPLFDRALAEFSFTIPPRFKRKADVEKYVFKKAVEDLLPGPIVYRKKAGMGVPLNHWFRRTALRGYARDLLTSRAAVERGYFEPKFVRRLLAGRTPKNALGKDRSGEILWMLLAVEIWHRVFVDQRGIECPVPSLTAS